MNDDAQFIEATLAGDSAAFGELVTRYQNRLYNTMVHVVGSTQDAQDVVQDAFVQAFVKLESFQRASAFYTWLYRIAFNLAMSHKRRQKPVRSLEEDRQQSGNEPMDGRERPDHQILQEERVGQVRIALASLSEEHRAILVLREMDGQPYEAIADILDLPVGTVRSRLHRARLQLRDQLKQVLQEELR